MVHVFLFLVAIGLSIPDAAAEGIGMVTGSKAGTYIQFGRETAMVARVAGVDILVKESEGSIANIKRMASKENAAFGIVQSDVLGFLKRSDDSRMQEIANKLRLVLPLYNEEVHLFANQSIQSFKDLQGKRLAVGKKESGNWLTSTNLLQLTDVTPSELLYLSPAQAVTAVLTGEADAMIYVAGKPVKLFSNLEKLQSKPEYEGLTENVHFVSLDDPKMLEEYEAGKIDSTDYPWFGESIPTIAVKALMISFDFSSRRNGYYVQRCRQLSVLGRTIRENIDGLKQTGHPKWQEVDLDREDIGIWELDACSRSVEKKDVDISQELEKLLLEE